MSKIESGAAVRKMTESGLMLAIAFALSMFPVMEMPFGGSVTAGSMLPVVLIAYRHGMKWGLFTGFAYSLLQLLTGLKNLSYATGAAAAASIILLDYLVAFTVLGLAGVFRKQKNQTVSLAAGTVLVCVLRYLCHVITGCTVWAGISIPTADGMLYSLSYNAAYMVPELIITLAAAVYLSRVLDFRSPSLRRVQADAPAASSACNAAALLLIAVAVVVDALLLFASIQTAEGYDIGGMANAAWTEMLIVTAVAAVGAVVLHLVSRAVSKKSTKN